MINRFERDLELQDDRVHALEVRRGRVDVGWHQPVVGTLDDDDAILTIGLDEDRCNAGRRAFDDVHMRGVDAEGGEIIDRRLPEQVVADLGHHHHLGAAKPRRDRLIRALSAEAQIEALAEQSFAGARERIREGHEVRDGATDYCNSG